MFVFFCTILFPITHLSNWVCYFWQFSPCQNICQTCIFTDCLFPYRPGLDRLAEMLYLKLHTVHHTSVHTHRFNINHKNYGVKIFIIGFTCQIVSSYNFHTERPKLLFWLIQVLKTACIGYRVKWWAKSKYNKSIYYSVWLGFLNKNQTMICVSHRRGG